MPLEPFPDELYCPCCNRDSLTEVPPCTDGHGTDCPDRACVECGTALLLDAVLVELARGPQRAVTRTTTRRTHRRGTRHAA